MKNTFSKPREKILKVTAAGVIILAFLFTFLIDPQMAKFHQARRSAQELQLKLIKMKGDLLLKDTIDETYAQVGEVIEAISPEGQNDASHLAELAGIMTYSLGNHLNMLTPRIYYYDETPVAIYQPKLSH